MSWTSDSSVTNSGWKICRTDGITSAPTPAPPTPAPTPAPPTPPATSCTELPCEYQCEPEGCAYTLTCIDDEVLLDDTPECTFLPTIEPGCADFEHMLNGFESI